MTQHSNEDANRTAPRITNVGFTRDPLGQHPDREGGDFCPFRTQPLRIALCQNRQEPDDFIKDLIENKDKCVCKEDVSEIDRPIVGDERVPLSNFISKKLKRDVGVQEMSENTEALANANRPHQTPAKSQKSVLEEELDDEAMGALFG